MWTRLRGSPTVTPASASATSRHRAGYFSITRAAVSRPSRRVRSTPIGDQLGLVERAVRRDRAIPAVRPAARRLGRRRRAPVDDDRAMAHASRRAGAWTMHVVVDPEAADAVGPRRLTSPTPMRRAIAGVGGDTADWWVAMTSMTTTSCRRARLQRRPGSVPDAPPAACRLPRRRHPHVRARPGRRGVARREQPRVRRPPRADRLGPSMRPGSGGRTRASILTAFGSTARRT